MKKKFMILTVLMLVCSTAFGGGIKWYGFLVDDSSPHGLIKNLKKVAVNQAMPVSTVLFDQKGNTQYRLVVSKTVFDAGYDALTPAEVDALVLEAKNNYSQLSDRMDRLIYACFLVIVDKLPSYTPAEFQADVTVKYDSLP